MARLQDTCAVLGAPIEFPEVPGSVFTTLLVVGFVIGGVGKLYDSRVLIALGIVLIVTAVIVLPVAVLVSGGGP